MTTGKWIWVCLVALMISRTCGADDASIDNRLVQLEKEIAELKQTRATSAEPTVSSDGKKKGLFSSVDVQFYGYIKADGSYDSSRTTFGLSLIHISEPTRPY
mgnify:CR=1 FL=1